MISNATIGKLQKLLQGEFLPYSALGETFRDELIAEGLLTIQVNGSRRRVRVTRPDALLIYLSNQYEEFRGMDKELIMQDYQNRADQAYHSGNSKLQMVRSCPGFLVNSYEPISCILNDETFVVNPTEGSLVFVNDWQHFSIPKDAVVVGVENMENFRKIRQQKYLFDKFGSVLFVSRYPQSTDLRTWLQTIPNQYIHFGDFDLAGIHIFQTEFQKYLGEKASFFIPDDIENRIAKGSIDRYNSQIGKFKDVSSNIVEIQKRIEIINRYHRCYDQEGYIVLSSVVRN